MAEPSLSKRVLYISQAQGEKVIEVAKKRKDKRMTAALKAAAKKDVPANVAAVQQLIAADPTKTHTNLQWLANRYVAGDFLLEDVGKLRGWLTEFAACKAKVEKTDINLYTAAELADVVEAMRAVDTRSNNEIAKDATTLMFERGDADLLLKTPDLTIVSLHTVIGSLHFGKGTRWCTAGSNDNAFYDYRENGPLYVFMGTRGKFQWAPDDQCCDERDSDVGIAHVLMRYPEALGCDEIMRHVNHTMSENRDDDDDDWLTISALRGEIPNALTVNHLIDVLFKSPSPAGSKENALALLERALDAAVARGILRDMDHDDIYSSHAKTAPVKALLSKIPNVSRSAGHLNLYQVRNDSTILDKLDERQMYQATVYLLTQGRMDNIFKKNMTPARFAKLSPLLRAFVISQLYVTDVAKYPLTKAQIAEFFTYEPSDNDKKLLEISEIEEHMHDPGDNVDVGLLYRYYTMSSAEEMLGLATSYMRRYKLSEAWIQEAVEWLLSPTGAQFRKEARAITKFTGAEPWGESTESLSAFIRALIVASGRAESTVERAHRALMKKMLDEYDRFHADDSHFIELGKLLASHRVSPEYIKAKAAKKAAERRKAEKNAKDLYERMLAQIKAEYD